MDKIHKLRRVEILEKVKINIIIIILWFSGILFSYLIFLNTHEGMISDVADYYVNTVSILCMLVILFSACMFYFLFNHTWEQNKIAKNMRASNFIAIGLDYYMNVLY